MKKNSLAVTLGKGYQIGEIEREVSGETKRNEVSFERGLFVETNDSARSRQVFLRVARVRNEELIKIPLKSPFF